MIAFFFFNDTATTEIYTLSLHDALPICGREEAPGSSSCGSPAGASSWWRGCRARARRRCCAGWRCQRPRRSEEHTSELQSRQYLVCRLLLEKKKKKT